MTIILIILYCRYPTDRVSHIQASNKDKEQDVHSSVITCLTVLNTTSLSRWASALSRVPQPWNLPTYPRGLQSCHMSHGLASHQRIQKGSGTVTCPMTPDITPLSRRALTLLHVPQLWTPPPYREGLCHCHTSHSSLWAASLKYKKRLN
jgi:hypothetical protein